MTYLSYYNVLVSILVGLLVLIVVLVKKRLDYFSSRGIPFVKTSWKIFFQSFSPSYMIDYQSHVYNSENSKDNYSVVGFFQSCLQPVLLVLDSSMVQTVLIRDFSSFHDRGLLSNAKRDPLALNLFNTDGDHWKSLRHKLLPTFSSGKMRGMIPAMEECAVQLMNDMKKDIADFEGDVEVHKLFRKYTISSIVSCAFGLDPENIRDPNSEFQRIFYGMLESSLYLQFKLFFIMFLPNVSSLFRLKIFPQHVDDFIINLTKDTMQMRKSSGTRRNDFVQILMELKEKGSVQVDSRDLEEDEKDLMRQQQQLLDSSTTKSKIEMTDELLAAQSFVFIAAGFDNAAYIIAVTSYLLSKREDIQRRIREEINAAKTKQSGSLNYLSLRDMTLLEASINEALRMYPPVQFTFRICTKPFKLRNGSTIEKGTQLVIPIKSLQNDSRYWPNPSQYNPDRFLNNVIQPGTFIPFGDGPRLCLGQRLTMLMSKIMLCEVLVDFELTSSDKTKLPIKQKSIISSEIEGGFWCGFRRLNQ